MTPTNFTVHQTLDPRPTDRADIIGNLVQGTAFGCHICVFFTTLYFVAKSRPHTRSKNAGIAFDALTCILFSLGTCQIVVGEILDEMAWVNHRNFPGGPMAWVGHNFERAMGIIQNTAYIATNILADGSMIYRLHAIWDGNPYILTIPVLTYFAIMAIMSLIQMEQPNGTLSNHAAVAVFVPSWFLAILLNVMLTLLIVLRLLYMRRSILGVLGAEHAIPYFSIIAILVESSAIFAIAGIIYIVSFEMESSFQSIALDVLNQCVCIAPELIVLRTAQGRVWTRKTNRDILSSLEVRVQGSTNASIPLL